MTNESELFERMQAQAAVLWGEQRAEEIAPTLRKLAAAVWSLEQIDFSPFDAPAAYLQEFANQGWESQLGSFGLWHV